MTLILTNSETICLELTWCSRFLFILVLSHLIHTALSHISIISLSQANPDLLCRLSKKTHIFQFVSKLIIGKNISRTDHLVSKVGRILGGKTLSVCPSGEALKVPIKKILLFAKNGPYRPNFLPKISLIAPPKDFKYGILVICPKENSLKLFFQIAPSHFIKIRKLP